MERTFRTNIRANVPRVKNILLPARINLLGGWSDQLLWEDPVGAAVVNVPFGWEDDQCFDGCYPMMVTRKGFYSVITGQGTGLGVSSIKAAAEFLLDDPYGDFVGHALQWEWDEGTRGGWQDQLILLPHLKLANTLDHQNFDIRCFKHPVLEHLVVFDSGIRRSARLLGDQVRALFLDDTKKARSFRDFIRELVGVTRGAITLEAQEFIEACLWSWGKFVEFVPDMDRLIDPDTEQEVKIPTSPLIAGHMMLGAGGGGFGLCFAKDPDCRSQIIQTFDKVGLWAKTPVYLPGAKLVWED